MLREYAEKFSAAHPDATVFIFSSWDVFSRVLADPTTGGFAEGVERVALFVDGFHPSSEFHGVFSREFLTFVDGVPPYSEER